MCKTWTIEQGIHIRSSAIPIDGDALLELFRYVVRGLIAFHWRTLLTSEDDISLVALTEAGEEYFDGLFSLATDKRIQGDLGNGTFKYEGSQAMDWPSITVWRIEAYGGLKFLERRNSAIASSRIGALTGPKNAQIPRTDIERPGRLWVPRRSQLATPRPA
jgi:hypothetical protein